MNALKKYTIRFLYNEEDGAFDNKYIKDAVEYVVETDLDTCMFSENISSENELNHEDDMILSTIDETDEKLALEAICASYEIVGEPKKADVDDPMISDDGTWYEVLTLIDLNKVCELLSADKS